MVLVVLLMGKVCYAGAINSMSYSFYDAFDPNATVYVYNSDNGVAVESGKLHVYNYLLKTVQVSIPTLGSTSVSVRVEGRSASPESGQTTWSDIYTKTYTAATTIDDVIMITEHVEYIRVGVKVVGSGTDAVTIKGNFGFPRSI